MVYRAISIHAVAVKQLSIDAYRGSEQIVAPAFLRQPNVDESLSSFLEQTTTSLASNGNAYWLLHRDAQGRVTNVQVLNPVEVFLTATPWGRVTKYSYKGTDFRPEQIKHLKLLRVPGSTHGLGPIQAAQTELRGALDLSDYASNWFAQSGVPAGGYLKSDQVLTAEQAKTYREAWAKAANDRTGVPVLGNGLQFNSLFLNPRDAQFLESQQFTTTQIARLFGVPSSLMLAQVEGNTQTYQNVEQDWIGYVRFSLTNYLVEIEEALTSLLPRGTSAKFNIEALLRSDTSSRYAAHAIGISAGWLLKSEVRAIEGLPPVAGIDLKPEPVAQPAPTDAPSSDSKEEPTDV
jgi:HK97 family phage portal protein